MRKTIRNNEAFYELVWSKLFRFDKYSASRILTEQSGVIALMKKNKGKDEYLLFYACWREGMRVSLKKLMDPLVDRHEEIRAQLDPDNLYYKYTAVETSANDLLDIIYWLVKTYQPELNDTSQVKDSGRYMNISVKEREMREGETIERFFNPV
ncbi:MAG TPA: hypothetical protein PK926_17815 [Spirochaetota bacterium]|nr:hypothetical protein [Spirochaetota bacterium]HPI91358.1 hypothetical protein [Spirochaetota bacterium]